MAEKKIFICPVCGGDLKNPGKSYTCAQGHSFDISKEGYVNLLLPNRRRSIEPGDSQEMIRSRHRFLNGGHYNPLAKMLGAEIGQAAEGSAVLLDAGCGEGFYTSHIETALRGRNMSFYGIDISREAIRLAAKKNKNITYAVAGLHHIPAAAGSVDIILNIFAPSPADEFARILSPGGCIYHVHPGERHLTGLREQLFDRLTPLEKEDRLETVFRLQKRMQLEFSFHVQGTERLADLINMTPYAWKTGRNKITSFLNKNSTLDTPAHFIISVYSK